MSEAEHRAGTGAENPIPPQIRNAPDITVRSQEVGEIVSTPNVQLDEHHRSFAEFHQGYVSSYIQLADTKAGWVFAIAAGLLVYVLGKDDLRSLLFPAEPSVRLAALILTVAFLAASAIFSFLVVTPRLPPSGEGVVSFFSVAKKPTAESYVREIASMTDSALSEARLKHSYAISGVCTKKYSRLWWACLTGVLGLAGVAVLTALL